MVFRIREAITVTAVLVAILLQAAVCMAETSSDEIAGLYVSYGQIGNAITMYCINNNNYKVSFRVKVMYREKNRKWEEAFQGTAEPNKSGSFAFKKIDACTYKAPCFDDVSLLYVKKVEE